MKGCQNSEKVTVNPFQIIPVRTHEYKRMEKRMAVRVLLKINIYVPLIVSLVCASYKRWRSVNTSFIRYIYLHHAAVTRYDYVT